MKPLTVPAAVLSALVLAIAPSLTKADPADEAVPVSVWEVATSYREFLSPSGRLRLLPDGKTESGIEWTLDGGVLNFGPHGSAELHNGGVYARGYWKRGPVFCGRLVMSNASLKTEPAAKVAVSKTAGQTLVGTRPVGPLADTIVDVWEFVATVPGTKKLIRLTTDFTADNQVLDGDRKIATYAIQRRAVTVTFIDDQFGKLVLTGRSPNVFSGRTKARKGRAWNVQFTRVQKQSVYRAGDNKTTYVLYTNNRVNSPRFTPDFDTSWHWFFYVDSDNIRRLWLRTNAAVLSADGRQWTMSAQKAVLIEGQPPKP